MVLNLYRGIFMHFQPYPFERLNALIKDISPQKDIIKLTIGEPQFETPNLICQALQDSASSCAIIRLLLVRLISKTRFCALLSIATILC